MADDKTFQVMYDYSDVPTLRKFTLSNKRVRCAMGPFGCVRGDTRIITEEGLLPISAIDRPMRVLSWNEKTSRFQLSLSGSAFPKGRDYLYQISTPQGESVVAGHHRVFCAGNKYRQVANLQVGDIVLGCSSDHLRKYSSSSLKSLSLDVPHYTQKVVDCLDRYARSARQYGQQFLQEADIGQVFSPLPVDVHTRVLYPCCNASSHMGDPCQLLQSHNHLDLFSYLIQSDDYSCQVERREKVGEDYIASQFYQRIFSLLQRLQQFPLKNVFHHVKKLFPWFSRSFFSSSLSEWPILDIKRLSVKETFWDMQVLETNNYVTEDGIIHHNSGKSSACVMDIIRRAHEQKAGPDGVKRSRYAIVRNSYIQLRDTTIRTFHDWFPPKLFGEYRVTDHTYIITKFPGVHLEILFRALDRPDQVSNLLSLEVTGAWFNEVREIPQTIIEAMDARIGRYPSKRDGGPSWYGIIMDTNPPDEDSYIYNMFERIKPDNWEIFKQPSGLSAHAENTKHLPKDYYKNLAKGKDEMYIRVYIHGQYGFIVAGKPVFITFKDNVHVAPNILLPERGLDVVLGFDFGLQPACTVGQLSKRGQLRILDELVSDGMGIRRFCNDQLLPLLRQKYFGHAVLGYGDPSGTSRAPTDESTCFEVLQSREIGLHNIVPAPTNAIMPRVGAVETYLGKMVDGEPGFLLSPNCRHLRKALNGGYHYERDRKSVNNEYKAMPVKNFSSHIADSLEMLCLYLQEKADADKRNKEFMAQIARLQHHSGSTLAGY